MSYDRRRLLLAGGATIATGLAGCTGVGSDRTETNRDGQRDDAGDAPEPRLGDLLEFPVTFSIAGTIRVKPSEEGTSDEGLSEKADGSDEGATVRRATGRVVDGTLELIYRHGSTRIAEYHLEDHGYLVVGDRCQATPIEEFDPVPAEIDRVPPDIDGSLPADPVFRVDAVEESPVRPGAFRARFAGTNDRRPIDHERVDGEDRFAFELPHGGTQQDRVIGVVAGDGRPVRIESRRLGEWVVRTWERRVRRVESIVWEFDDSSDDPNVPDESVCGD